MFRGMTICRSMLVTKRPGPVTLLTCYLVLGHHGEHHGIGHHQPAERSWSDAQALKLG
jgi:hypothetical protein